MGVYVWLNLKIWVVHPFTLNNICEREKVVCEFRPNMTLKQKKSLNL